MRYGLTTRPVDAFQNLRRLNSFLDEAIGGFPFGGESGALTAAWTPAVDVFEGRDAVKIVAELPGVKAEDVRISLENQTLTLRGEKRQVAEEKTERVHRKVYGTRDEARADVFDYVERFYNLRRRHSTLDYLSPAEYEMTGDSA